MKILIGIFKAIVLLLLGIGFFMTFVASVFPPEWGGLGWLIGNVVYVMLASLIIYKVFK